MFSDRKKTYDWKKSEENAHRYKNKSKKIKIQKNNKKKRKVSCGQKCGCVVKKRIKNFLKKIPKNKFKKLFLMLNGNIFENFWKLNFLNLLNLKPRDVEFKPNSSLRAFNFKILKNFNYKFLKIKVIKAIKSHSAQLSSSSQQVHRHQHRFMPGNMNLHIYTLLQTHSRTS